MPCRSMCAVRRGRVHCLIEGLGYVFGQFEIGLNVMAHLMSYHQHFRQMLNLKPRNTDHGYRQCPENRKHLFGFPSVT